MKSSLMAVLVLVSSLSLSLALAGGQDLQKTLTDQYQDKILVLRHCYTAGSQEYDVAGKLISKRDEGPWPFYGRIQIKKIDLTAEKLRLEGNRVTYQFDGQGRLIPVQNKEQVRIAIRLDQPLTAVDQATTVLGRVFAITQEDVMEAAPPYWRPYLAKHLAEGPDRAQDQTQTSHGIDFTDGAGTEKIFHVGPDVTPPKPLLTPEPDFSETARKQISQGVVGLNVIVDSTGRVSSIKIVKPLGRGLDEEAVKTIRAWRFGPAMHKGQPVAVAVYIEIDFHLY
jgi:TonB family protein